MPHATHPSRPRARARARRFGHLLAALIDAVLLYLINVRPGWDAVPFLTAATVEVLPLVNASLAVGIAVELIDAAADRRRVKALGDVVTTAVGLAAMLAIWRVFPLDFAGTPFDWALVARIALAVGIGGSVLAILIAIVTLLRPSRAGARGRA